MERITQRMKGMDSDMAFMIGFTSAVSLILTGSLVSRLVFGSQNSRSKDFSSKSEETTLSHLHHLDLTAAQRNVPLNDAVTHENPHVFQIVLTGGPCAGKSSCQEHFAKELRARGFDVYLVPEVPTMLQNAGCAYPGLDGGDRLITFETSLIELQLQMEQTFFAIAQSTGRKSVIIFDRGLLDVAAYLPIDKWSQVLNHNKWLQEGFLSVSERYDLIIHLVTAAIGAEKVYESLQRNRKESLEEAIILDQKIYACWHGHPHHRRVDNSSPTFQGKLDRATDHLLELVINHKLL